MGRQARLSKGKKAAARFNKPKAAPKGKKSVDDDPMNDEIDQFMEGYDEVSFEPKKQAKKTKQISDDEEDDYAMKISAERSLRSDSDDAMDDISDDDSDDLRVPDASDDDDQEPEQKSGKKSNFEEKFDEWGRLEGKHKYHGKDVSSDEENYDNAQEQEEEARLLQQKHIKALKEDDFTLGDEQDQESSDDSDDQFWDEAEQKTSYKKAAQSIKEVSIAPASKSSTLEKISTKSAPLSAKEKLQILESESPELLALLSDFKAKLHDLKTNVKPLLTEVSKHDLPTSEGISFLEAKFHLLLNYCMNIGFYMLLKAEGKSVQDHPVITQLVKLRLLLEKIAPIDQKLHYQVQKLLKLAVDGTPSGDDQALRHKPNLDSLESTVEQDEQESSGKYKLKKIAPVAYGHEEDPDKKQKKRKIRSSSAVSEFIQEEFGDAPVEISYGNKLASSEQEKQEIEFEEEHFVRVGKLAKQRRQKEKQLLQRSVLEDPLNFSELSSFADLDDRDSEKSRSGRSKLAQIISGVDASSDPQSTEVDLPYPSYDRRLPNKRKLEEFNQNHEEDDFESSEEVVEDDYYEQVQHATKKRKLETKQLHSRTAPVYRDDSLDDNAKRGLTFEISANRGLTRHRSKKMRNPRIRYKDKATKMDKKYKKVVRPVQEKTASYGGEATGIRKSVKRSINLK